MVPRTQPAGARAEGGDPVCLQSRRLWGAPVCPQCCFHGPLGAPCRPHCPHEGLGGPDSLTCVQPLRPVRVRPRTGASAAPINGRFPRKPGTGGGTLPHRGAGQTSEWDAREQEGRSEEETPGALTAWEPLHPAVRGSAGAGPGRLHGDSHRGPFRPDRFGSDPVVADTAGLLSPTASGSGGPGLPGPPRKGGEAPCPVPCPAPAAVVDKAQHRLQVLQGPRRPPARLSQPPSLRASPAAPA